MAWTDRESSNYAGSGSYIRGKSGAAITSASTIAITDFVHEVSGSATITTITAPSNVEDALFVLIPAASSTWTAARPR